jgi:hypothetical protein
VEHGVYQDEHQGSLLSSENYRVGETSTETQELAYQLAEDQKSQVRHDAINPPDHRNPFPDSHAEREFFAALRQIIEGDIIPTGYGLFSDEWEDGEYPVVETIKVGRRAGKTVDISLAEPIWQHCTVLWVQSLDLLTRFREYI